MNDLEQIGKELAVLEDKLLFEDTSIDDAEIKLLRRIEEDSFKTSSVRKYKLLIVFAASIFVVGILAIFGFLQTTQKNSSVVSAGKWFQASLDKSFPIDFGDGNKVILKPGSKCRVVEANDKGTVIVLESGTAKVKVVHRDNTNWRVNAGPYEVQVTGTQFDVNWKSEKGLFELNMIEGNVLVFGPLVTKGKRVSKNQSFVASVIDKQIKIAMSSDNDSYKNSKVQKETIDNKIEDNLDLKTLSQETKKPILEKPLIVKKELFKERSIPKRSVSRVQNKMDVKMLLEQADSERLAGHLSMAEKTYKKIHTLYTHTGYATTAAFSLGKMAFDQQHNYKKASYWFKIYLRNQHGKSLRGEAQGRLMEAQLRCKELSDSRDTALKYLNNYPNGPYARKAKNILKETKSN